MTMEWKGVMPAITTPFNEALQIDHDFFARHIAWLLDAGCTGIVTPGSLGENATLTIEETRALLETAVKAADGRAPIVAGVAALSTQEAVAFAQGAERAGCRGLMVLPPYVYRGDWREMRAHVDAIFAATNLSCMLYNNPIAYGTDFLPAQIAELAAAHANFHAVKESSADVRRVTELRALLDDRLALFVGVDDLIVEAIAVGAVGWIAGLVSAFPKESVALFDLAMRGETAKARALYEWFLPLLRLDTVPKFVQLIKLVQQEVGMGNERVRPPRLPLTGAELAETKALVATALRRRPTL